MKRTINLLLIFSLLVVPVYANDRNPRPVPSTPAGGNDNHNNDSDNLKHTAEAILLTGIVYCIISKCLYSEEKTVIHFKTKQEAPNVP